MLHVIHANGYPKGFNCEVVTPVIDTNNRGGVILMNNKGQVLRLRNNKLEIWVTLSKHQHGFIDDLLGAAYSYNLTKPEIRELIKALELSGRQAEIEILQSLL
jgi:hypothetical protein